LREGQPSAPRGVVYAGRVETTGAVSPTAEPEPFELLRESLAASRAAGVGFQRAWRIALREVERHRPTRPPSAVRNWDDSMAVLEMACWERAYYRHAAGSRIERAVARATAASEGW